jgi:3-oxoacyl-[acyl-carrier protein] reductase
MPAQSSTPTVYVPTASLAGKVALITGAGRGIGRGCAVELGKRGASVVVNYVSSKEAAEEVVKIIEGFGNGAKAVAIQADVSKVSEIYRLFEEAKKAMGKIDIVMSNSGTESWDKTEDITEEKFDHVFNLNARAQFFVGQAAWKYLEDNGRVILMSSIAAGLLGVYNHALYNASKMAVIGFVKAFATDFGARGITVNGVAPGGIKSDMFVQNAWHYIPGATPEWPGEKIEKMAAEHCPLKRVALPDDVARVVAFLASEDGGWVNGKFIAILPRTAADMNRPGYHHFRWIFSVDVLLGTILMNIMHTVNHRAIEQISSGGPYDLYVYLMSLYSRAAKSAANLDQKVVDTGAKVTNNLCVIVF